MRESVQSRQTDPKGPEHGRRIRRFWIVVRVALTPSPFERRVWEMRRLSRRGSDDLLEDGGCDVSARTRSPRDVSLVQQLLERVQHRQTGDPELVGQPSCGRQTLAGAESSLEDRRTNPVVDLLVERGAGRRVEREVPERAPPGTAVSRPVLNGYSLFAQSGHCNNTTMMAGSGPSAAGS